MKKLSLLIIILALLVVSFGCTKETPEPIDKPGAEVPIEEPTDVPPEELEEDEVVIEPVEKLNVDNLTVLDEYDFDFDKDGNEEKIAMYTVAQRDSNGNIAWDDGQDWKFIVHGTDKDYVLVDEYVQLGSINFNIYTIEDEFYIATYSARTASLVLNIYHYDRELDSFVMITPYKTEGNVNMIKSSYGY